MTEAKLILHMREGITVTSERQKRDKRDLDRTNTKSREERREKASVRWKLRPIEQYENHKSDITENDLKNRVKTIREFDDYLSEKVNPQTDSEVLDPRDAVQQDVEDFIENELDPDPDTRPTTVRDKLKYISEFYTILNKKSAYAGNPVTEPLKEYRETHDFETDRPYIPKHRINKFLDWLDRPLSRALWILAFKLGIRTGECVNLDLHCLNIDHPVFEQIIKEHNIKLHSKVRDRPDTIFVYSGFNSGTEIPNEDTAGRKDSGEVRHDGNKRKNDDGSVLPLDSETKTALIEWLLVRPSTARQNLEVHPVFTVGSRKVRRLRGGSLRNKLWRATRTVDSIQHFAEEESLAGENCPACGKDQLVESNPSDAERPGRRFRCRECGETHWRSIYWGSDLGQAQRVTYHQGRHSFSSAHNPTNSGLHDDSIPNEVRKKAIRGDDNDQGDTEDTVYIEGKYRDFEADVRQPYLNGIYKFGVYDNPIPAVGEGWEQQ